MQAFHIPTNLDMGISIRSQDKTTKWLSPRTCCVLAVRGGILGSATMKPVACFSVLLWTFASLARAKCLENFFSQVVADEFRSEVNFSSDFGICMRGVCRGKDHFKNHGEIRFGPGTVQLVHNVLTTVARPGNWKQNILCGFGGYRITEKSKNSTLIEQFLNRTLAPLG